MTRPGRRAVVGLLLVLVLAALVLGARVAMARGAATPRPVTSTAGPSGLVARSLPPAFATSSGSPSGVGAASPSAAVATSVAQSTGSGPAVSPSNSPSMVAGKGPAGGAGAVTSLVVDVVGQVRRPGVVRLPPGSRVLDAVAAAGGALRSAQTSAVNLARPVADGEQIQIPKPGQSPAVTGVAPQPATAGSPASSGPVVVDLNSADATALDSLPGVGPVLAQRILDWRTQHGRFSSVDELGEVSGIGDKLLAEIGPHVRV